MLSSTPTSLIQCDRTPPLGTLYEHSDVAFDNHSTNVLQTFDKYSPHIGPAAPQAQQPQHDTTLPRDIRHHSTHNRLFVTTRITASWPDKRSRKVRPWHASVRQLQRDFGFRLTKSSTCDMHHPGNIQESTRMYACTRQVTRAHTGPSSRLPHSVGCTTTPLPIGPGAGNKTWRQNFPWSLCSSRYSPMRSLIWNSCMMSAKTMVSAKYTMSAKNGSCV